MRAMKGVAGAMLCAALAACGTNLVPAPQAKEVPGPGAYAVEEGIRMVARPDVWSGNPRNLHEMVTPIFVTITNESTVPVRIDYSQFRLVSAQGRRYSALPPFAIDATLAVPVPGDRFYPPVGFGYAPYFAPYFTGAPTWGDYEVNPLYWSRFEPVLARVDLPTVDMLRRALPEGVLQPGGEVSGFLYFEGVGPGVERVLMRADFRSPATKERFARLEIPFVVS